MKQKTDDAQADGGVPNLIRGLKALERLATHLQGLLAAELARLLDVPKNSMGRILAAMDELGFVMKGPADNRYRVTRKLLYLGSACLGERHLVSESLEEMLQLRNLLNETVLLTVPMGDHGITLEQVAPHKPIHIRVEPGARCELYNTAPGKLFLGWMSEADAQAYLRHTAIVKSTPHTLGRHALIAQIESIRKQGYAIDKGEALEGSNCFSGPHHRPERCLRRRPDGDRLLRNNRRETVPKDRSNFDRCHGKDFATPGLNRRTP